MTRFENGPAHGVTLMLRRAPYFLRVTCADGKYDGLDQVSDSPTEKELIFAYRLKERPGHCHIRAAKGAGGFFPMATYEYVETQPPDATMRDNADWVKWTEAQTEDRKRYDKMLQQ